MTAYAFKMVVSNRTGVVKAPGFWLYRKKYEIPGVVLTKSGDDTWQTTIDAEEGEVLCIVLDVRVKADGGVTLSIKARGGEEYYPISKSPLPPDSDGKVSMAWNHKLKA